MKYENFTVYGFPRSGQHYLSALLARNFFHDSHYAGRTGAHTIKPELHTPGEAVFYILRDFEDVTDSIFKLRHVFRLHATDRHALQTMPINLMFTPGMVGKADLNDMDSVQRTEKGGGFFRSQFGLLKHAWRKHIDAWKTMEAGHVNVMLIRYDRLIKRFDGTMRNIAKFLGSNRKEFENITERVGWYPPGEYW